jgi:hypothetical protein
MSSQNEVHDKFETKDMRGANLEVNDAMKIEKILRRAKEIHRERGGVLGYDFEEWLQAWNELPTEGAEANGAASRETHGIRLAAAARRRSEG